MAEPLKERLQIKCAMFHVIAQPKTNCVFRTFRVKESFWAKKQSLITLKVGMGPFFNYVRVKGWVGGMTLCSKTLIFCYLQGKVHGQ